MDTEAGVSLRQVKLKVLYTFDAEHKNNHLARWPQTLEIQSAQLDEINTIGCIDLHTCLQAVLAASPELASSIDSDFTIYAYDYSEPDTPLVGQGMLSKALAQEEGVELDNEAMVTGRITKNVMGLFSKSAQETLEVKLRLTPVASSGFRRRSGSISSNPDTVQSQWNSLSQMNGAFRPSSPMNTSGLEAVQRMLNEGAPSRDRMGSYQAETLYNQGQNTSRPTSRAGTPSQSQQYNSSSRPPAPQSRPSSRAGMRSTGHARRDSFNSGYFSGEDTVEEGPARKRAKVQKVEHPSRSNLNIERQSDSLRVAASTASSVRLHRPVPLNPAAAALQHSNLIDDPIRPPTPIAVPTKTGRPRGRPRKVVSANLLRGPKPRASSPAHQAQQQTAESSFSSPEETRADSAISTPADLPSSPPVMPETQNLVTSPQLPPLMNETDSGFMSGCLEDLFGEDGPLLDDAQLLDFNDFLHDKPLDFQQPLPDFQHLHSTTNTTSIEKDTMANLPPVFDESNDIERPVTEMEPPPPPPKSSSVPALPKANSFTTHHRPIVPAPRLAPALAPKAVQPLEQRRAQSLLPQIPASDPIGRTFQRSNTWAPEMSDAVMSDAVTIDEHSKVRPKKRVGKEQTKARLENAIASGEMPPFCDNCGSIETPAWRRAYTKIFDCPWDQLETSLEPGECCYKEPIEHDAEGTITKFKGYKSERRSDDKSNDGWTQICLCNPCGLWFHKSKFPRPPEKWQKKDPNEKKKRKRGPKSKKRTNVPRPSAKSDAPTPASDGSSPTDTAAEGGDMDDNIDGMTTNGDDANDDNEPELPPMPREVRGGSAEPANRGLRFSSSHRLSKGGRQVQSSPARAGRTRANAIEIDLTPRPVARQLFPSPQSLKNKYLAAATTVGQKQQAQFPTFVRRSPRLNKVRDIFATPVESTALVSVSGVEKENIAPALMHDGLEGLFDGGFDEIMPPPSTPKRRSERLLFKTPGRTPSREFGEAMSPNVQRTPTVSRTPKTAQSVISKFINGFQSATNPGEMTPFTRSIHESLYCGDVDTYNFPQTPCAGGSGRSRKSLKNSSSKDLNDLFDFPDLPSLKGSSPMGVDLMQAFDFSEMTTDRLPTDFHDTFSTDAPMPSSPPKSYFDYAGSKDEQHDNIWADINLQDDIHSAYPDLDESGKLRTIPDQGLLRRSPRKHAA